MSSSYKWIFSDAYLGKNPDTHSYETMCNLDFKQLNTNTELDNDNYIEIHGGNISGYKITEYEDIAYIDLNSVHSPDSSFTLEFSVTELDQIDTTKAINYLTFGYQVRGKSGVTLTVGRPENSSNVVIGTITESSTAKAVVYDSTFFVEPDTQYDYTLTYNNFATDEEKLKLFRGPHLISTSSNFGIQNYSIVDRKLFLGSSAWTNEPSWSNVFDLSTNVVFNDTIQFHTNKVIDKSFVPSSPFYPLHYSFENITNDTRNTHQIAVKDDVVEIKFHSTKDVPTNNVYMNIDGLSNNSISQTNVENPFILGNGSNTVMYTYQFQVTDSWPTDGLLSYGLDMYGNVTVSNIFPPMIDNIYIDNTIPTLAYTFNPPSHNNVSFTITEITDAYMDIMTNQTPFEYYNVTFYASNNVHVRSNVVNNPNISQSYFVENLDDETIYTLYATITDRANNITDRILPSNGSEIVETVDITAPVIQFLNTATITDNADKIPGIKVTTSTYDTATELTVNTHNYTVYISILEENISDINVVKSKLTANNLFQQLKTNFTAETIEQEMLKYYDTNNVQQDIVTEKTFYIYCLVIDNGVSPNKHFTKTSHFINNILTLTNIVSDFSTNDIAELGNTLTVTFESDFKLYDKSQFAITMMEDTVTNATSANGLNWTATNIVKDTNSSGEILFSVAQTPDIDSVSSFNQTNHPDTLYIQKQNPLFKSGVDNTLSTGLTSLTVTNLQNYIDDFTINSNNNLFCLDVYVLDENNGKLYSTHSQSDPSSIELYLNSHITTTFNVHSVQSKTSMTQETAIQTMLNNNDYISVTSDTTNYYFNDSTLTMTEIMSDFNTHFSVSPGHTTWLKNRDYVRKVYNNISEFPDDLTFMYLKENKPYEVRASISNLFAESSDQIIGTITTQKDIPTISIDTTNTQKDPLTHYPVVQIDYNTSSATENTTDYNLYVRLADFNITDPSTIKSFMLSTPTVNATPIIARFNNTTRLNNYFRPFGFIENFYTGTSSSYTETQIIPSTTNTYYLYAMIDDTATEPIFDKKTITFDFTFTEAVLENTSYNYFVRNGDTVQMTWSTTYVSQGSDFTNVKLFGVNAAPTSANGKDWTAQVTITDGTADHSVSYLGTPLTINASLVLYDNAAPTFTIDIHPDTIGKNVIVANLTSFGADAYTDGSVPAHINTDYTVDFSLTKVEDMSVLNYSFTKDYANLISNNYSLTGLEEAKDYTITCTLTDPAQNTITINYDSGNPVQTSDITKPVIVNLTSTINTKDANNTPGLTVESTTIDNNDHTVYLSIFDYALTGTEESIKDTITTNNLSNDLYDTINTNTTTTKQFYKYFKHSDLTEYDIRTEETYYIYCMAVDIDGNFVIFQNVKTIDNTFSNPSIVTNFSKNDIAEVGNDIIVSFTTDYRLFPDQLQVSMMGDSITPVSSDNGLTWIATNTVTNAHVSGKVIFSVAQTPDISTTSSFDDTSLGAVYIQKENPGFFTLPVANNIHNITVSLNANTKYIFTPSVTSFVKGHTYIFDNTGASTNTTHPLRFTSSSTHPGMDSPTILFKDDVNHSIVVTITDSTPGPIYAHCGVHSSDMGSVVNTVSGIPIVEETNISFGSVTNEIVVSNIGTNINDFTINSNNDLLKLTVELGDQTITNTYNNKSEIPSSFTFANLTENTQYEVKASISNLFAESTDIVLGNANTSFDLPSITIEANVSTLNDEPVVQLLNTSKVTEHTSAFDIYIEVTDFLFADNTEVSSFVTSSSTAKLTNIPVGTDIDYVSQLISTKLTTYWSRNGAAFVSNNLIPSTTTQYYVYTMIDDHAHIIHNKADLTFDFTVSDASLSNTTYPYFVRSDDVVNMSWNTTFKSAVSDFTNVTIFNQTPETTPTTTDYLNWSTSVTIPSTGINTHTVTVSLNANTKYIFTPSVTSFVKGHTYIFDNTGPGSQNHPLRFTTSSSHSGGTVLFQNDTTHIIEVTVTDTTPNPIYAHCGNHQNMGEVVNGGSGISVVNDTSSIQHSITYLNTDLVVISDNVLFDNAAPTFDIVLDSTTETTFNFTLTNFGSDAYTNQVIPLVGIDNTYSVLFKATHTNPASNIEKTFDNISYDNLIINTFTIDNLLEGNAYSIEATLTDPANNIQIIQYNSGNLIVTNDTTLPVITNIDTEVTHVSSQTTVSATNIKAHDLHSTFDMYAGLFTTNTINFDIQSLKDNSNTQAVIYQQNNPATPTYVSLDGTFEKVLSYNGSSWTTSAFEYNRDYYMYVGVEDTSGNINSNNGVVFMTVTMLSGASGAYFDPSTGSFVEPVEGDTPPETTTTDITQDAQSALVFQPVVSSDPNVDTSTDTTTYAAYDTSGNNNHIYFSSTDTDTNPLSTNAIVNDFSVDIGLTTGISLNSGVSIAGGDGFTYITHVNNTNEILEDTVLLQNNGNDFLIISDTGVTVNTDAGVFFPVDITSNEWNSVTVSTENDTIRVFINGEELLPTPETANNYNPSHATGALTIPPQQNVLLDGITVFNTPVNDAIIETVVSSGEFKIKLDFENPPIQSFNVSYSNSKFYLNDESSPSLVFNRNADYTFMQASSNGIPLILSETGTFPVSSTDALNVS